MLALKALPILLVLTSMALDSSAAGEDPHRAARFTGLYRKEGKNGRPETVRITDGKSFIDISEKEYRERGYAPPYAHLMTRIIQRLPVRRKLPDDWKD